MQQRPVASENRRTSNIEFRTFNVGHRTGLADALRRVAVGLLLAGLLAGCEGDPAGSRDGDATRSSRIAPESIEKALAAADEYLSTGELVKAEVILARLIEQVPREVRARELMGHVLALKAEELSSRRALDAADGVWREAYRQYQAAAELDPDSAGLHQSAGVIALAAGESESALEHFLRAAELDRSNAQHPLYAAQIFIQQQRFEEAQAMLDRVLALDPEEPLAHASRAAIALAREDHDEALRHVGVAREIAPRDLRLRVQEARIHRLAGDVHQALELLAPLSARERAELTVAEEMALAFAARGDHERAAEVWAHRFHMQQEAPGAFLSAVRAGQAMLRAGRRDEASRWLRAAQVAGGNAPEVRALEASLTGSFSPR